MPAFVTSLIIPLLISGPFFSDLLVSISSLLFLFYIFKHKFLHYFTNIPLIVFFIFCIYCVFLSIFIAQDTFLSFGSSLFYFRVGVFACLIWYLIETNKKILNYFYFSMLICFFLLMLDSYLQYFFGFSIVGEALDHKGKYLLSESARISSFFGDELIMGSYLSRLFPLLFALYIIREKRKFETYSMVLFFILLSGVIYISGERAAFFLHCLSLAFILIFLKNYKYLRYSIFIGLVVTITVFTLNNNHLQQRMITKPLSMTNNYIFSKFHDSVIRTAFNMFLDKPVTGHGPKMFRVQCKNEKYAEGISPCMNHPHNFYIQLLAETGVIGFLFLLASFLYVIYCSIKQLKSMIFMKKRFLNDYQVCLLAGILITVWPLTTNGNFFHNWLMIAYSLSVGFYLHSIYGKNRKEILKE